MNIFDRALLRRFSDAPATLLSNCGTAAVIPTSPRKVTVKMTKKRKRFIRKVTNFKADLSHGSLESLQKQVKSLVVPSTSLSSPSVSDTAPPDFALLYYTLVKDDALPVG